MRTIAATLIALALSSVGVGIASAHTALVSSDPAKDANLTKPPAAIVLTFSENINPAFATIVVSSADGRKWVSGSPQVDGPRLTAAVGPGRPATGVYTVGYRVVSTDGHPVTGSYTFTIAGTPNEPPPPLRRPSPHRAPPLRPPNQPPRGRTPRQRSSPLWSLAWPSAGRSPSGNRGNIGAEGLLTNRWDRRISRNPARIPPRGLNSERHPSGLHRLGHARSGPSGVCPRMIPRWTSTATPS